MADNWLKTNLDPLMKNSALQNDGLLVIAFDESANDVRDAGDRIAIVLTSPRFSVVTFQSTTLFQHETVLRLMLKGLGRHHSPRLCCHGSKNLELVHLLAARER
jgi:hypothetical protein